MTMPDQRRLLCVTYTLGFGIHIVGEIGYEMIRFTYLVRPKLPNIHDGLLASAPNQSLNGEGCRAWYLFAAGSLANIYHPQIVAIVLNDMH
jgi:hypothetical protein